MPLFPKIQSPCPYKSQLASVMDGDFCRMCERQVFDLSAMADEDRRAFLAGCAEEVCVSYRVPLRTALASAALAVAAAAAPASAHQPASIPAAVDADIPAAEEISEPDLSMEVIIVGGIKDPKKAEFVELPEDEAVPELPVVYEDDMPAAEGGDRSRVRASPAA
jgi:predicted Fe-S protein YdhL (DUF1289 family)